jgi:RHS repeat-associated protein
MHMDHLGSTTFLTDHTGATTQKTLYYPWGQLWNSGGTVKDERFASLQQRDAETGNDSTLFRMYQPRLYRWLSPDPLAGDISNPQSLNRYAYVLNNPTNLTDPLGLTCSGSMRPSPGSSCIPFDSYTYTPGTTTALIEQMGTQSGYTWDDVATGVVKGTISIDGYGNWSWRWSPPSHFQWLFHGRLFGHYYAHTFDTWDDYTYWLTGIAARPESKIYAGWQLACSKATACTGNISVVWKGLTPNVTLQGSTRNSSTDLWDPDPLGNHPRPSYYTWDLVDAGHYYQERGGVGAHIDSFNGVLAFPLHLIFDVVPSIFVNPGSGTAGGTYTCSVIGGCH